MKDFPVFTTDTGVSSLTLKEIPYRKEAYIEVRDVQPGGLADHLAECASFCRIAGADHVYAAAHQSLEDYPFHVSVIEMRGDARPDEDQLENIWPVTSETVGDWRRIYNERMAGVDLSSTLEAKDEETIASSGGAYFIHSRGKLLGIGWLEGETLKALAAVEPGAGLRVASTLLSVQPGQSLRLEVASTNQRAIRLYERLGFLRTAELTRWYKII